MLEKMSQAYYTMLNHLGLAKSPPGVPVNDWNNIRQFEGTLVFYVNRRGFWGIVSDDGQKFFPVNLMQYPRLTRDRLRVHVVLETFPGVSNYYQYGQTARLMGLEPINLNK